MRRRRLLADAAQPQPWRPPAVQVWPTGTRRPPPRGPPLGTELSWAPSLGLRRLAGSPRQARSWRLQSSSQHPLSCRRGILDAPRIECPLGPLEASCSQSPTGQPPVADLAGSVAPTSASPALTRPTPTKTTPVLVAPAAAVASLIQGPVASDCPPGTSIARWPCSPCAAARKLPCVPENLIPSSSVVESPQQSGP